MATLWLNSENVSVKIYKFSVKNLSKIFSKTNFSKKRFYVIITLKKVVLFCSHIPGFFH